MKKSVDKQLRHMIEGSTAYDTYKDLMDMAPDKNTIMTILAELQSVCSIYIKEYILQHQSIQSRRMKADPQGITEASTHPAHMTRMLDGQTDDKQITMNYLMSC